jgi:hypothetical protein
LASLVRGYGWFISIVLLVSALALRLPFYPLDDTSFLKRPGIFSFSEILQLVSVIAAFLWLANAFIEDNRLLDKALTVYWRVGVLNSVYAVASYFVLRIFGSIPLPETL